MISGKKNVFQMIGRKFFLLSNLFLLLLAEPLYLHVWAWRNSKVLVLDSYFPLGHPLTSPGAVRFSVEHRLSTVF